MTTVTVPSLHTVAKSHSSAELKIKSTQIDYVNNSHGDSRSYDTSRICFNPRKPFLPIQNDTKS